MFLGLQKVVTQSSRQEKLILLVPGHVISVVPFI